MSFSTWMRRTVCACLPACLPSFLCDFTRRRIQTHSCQDRLDRKQYYRVHLSVQAHRLLYRSIIVLSLTCRKNKLNGTTQQHFREISINASIVRVRANKSSADMRGKSHGQFKCCTVLYRNYSPYVKNIVQCCTPTFPSVALYSSTLTRKSSTVPCCTECCTVHYRRHCHLDSRTAEKSMTKAKQQRRRRRRH